MESPVHNTWFSPPAVLLVLSDSSKPPRKSEANTTPFRSNPSENRYAGEKSKNGKSLPPRPQIRPTPQENQRIKYFHVKKVIKKGRTGVNSEDYGTPKSRSLRQRLLPSQQK